jgi:DNA polymerase
MRKAVQACRGCHLYRHATQAVFGNGAARAPLLIVGEQPGNDEDLAGEPFVGPAGRLLHDALESAGIPRTSAYVTNVVKHFKFERAGKRRIHKRPMASEVNACRPWLENEIAQVRPRVLLCLGATAAQALLGRQFLVTARRGQLVETPFAEFAIATVHPSSILRQRTSQERAQALRAFVADLQVVAKTLGALAPRRARAAGVARSTSVGARSRTRRTATREKQ